MGRHAARHSCPFCDHGYTDMKSVDDNRMGKRCQRLEDGSRPQRFYVRCCSCGGCGPMDDTKDGATTLWNARPDRHDEAGMIAAPGSHAIPLDVDSMIRRG